MTGAGDDFEWFLFELFEVGYELLGFCALGCDVLGDLCVLLWLYLLFLFGGFCVC